MLDSERHNPVSPQGVHDITSADISVDAGIVRRKSKRGGDVVVANYTGPSARDRRVQRAHYIVWLAIKRGTLPELDGLRCVDCDAPAECYDHRNYFEPLKVDPVCKGCNNRRGPGFPFPTAEDGALNKKGIKSAGMRWSSVEGGADEEAPTEHKLHAAFDWQEAQDAVDDGAERGINAKSFRFVLRNSQKRGLAKTARYEYFKARDPWALTETFGEFA
jgi:hypothetical protein